MSTPEKAKRDNEKLRGKIATQMREKYDRMLPLDEMLLDRWKKAEFLGFGEQTGVYENVYIYGKPKIGRSLGRTLRSFRWNRRAYNRRRLRHQFRGHDFYSLHTFAMCFKKNMDIKEACKNRKLRLRWKRSHSFAGVAIGDNSVIGAGAVVSKDVPALSVVMGVPAKIVGKVVLKGKKAKIEFNNNLDGQ